MALKLKEKNSLFLFSAIHFFIFNIILCLFISSKTYSQTVSSSYIFSQVDSGLSYSTITGAGTSPGLVASGSFTNVTPASVALPFGFNFNGVSYSTVYISDNGFLTFGAAAANNNYSPISVVSGAGAISGFGCNLQAAATNLNYTTPPTSEVRYETQGVAPNRVFVVQYSNVVRRVTVINQNGLLNFQIRLNETTNVIEVVYDVFNPSLPVPANASGAGGQVGLRGATNTDFNNRTSTANGWLNTIAGSLNSDSMSLNSTLFNNTVTKFIWTPCYLPTGVNAVMQANNSTVDVTWTEPVFKPSSYSYEVRSSGLPGSGANGLFTSGTINSPISSVSIPGLIACVNYTIYIRSNCRNDWSRYVSATFSPIGLAATIPYTQDFESVTAPAIPTCNYTQMVSGANMITLDNSATALYGFNNKNLATASSLAMDTWYFTQKINFPIAGSYRLSYKYGGTREAAFFIQKMRVAYGPNAAATATGMTGGVIIADHNSIKLSPLTNIINFTVSTPGIYYIGFQGYADATNGTLQIDDINLDYSSCKPPTALVSAQITSTSAIISWTPPNTSPNSGYQYIVVPSVSAISPINTTLPTGSTAPGETLMNLGGLTPSTTYSFWVRTDCGGGDVSEWSMVGSFTTLAPYVTICNPAPTSVDGIGITNVSFGSINNSSGAEAGNYGNYSNFTTNIAQTTTVTVAITFNTLTYNYNTKIWIDWNNDGDFTDSGEEVYSGLSGTTSPNTLNASFVVPVSVTGVSNTQGPHRMRIGGCDIATPTPCYNSTWGTFEDYSVFVISPPPPLTINSSNFTICQGEQTEIINITTPLSNFQVYTWSPSTGVSGSVSSGFTFSPSVTTTYTLTATQTTGNFSSNSVKYTVYVNPLPTPIVITPLSTIRCQTDPASLLVANGGIVSGSVVFEENFNGPTNSFTTVNNSVNGNPALSAWTLRQSPYNRNGNISSNDNSQFYFSDSDIQGSAGTTNTELISPIFSLAAPITDATLSFWHYYRGWISGTASVQISTNGGLFYTTLPSASWTTASTGSPTSFSQVSINLSAYVGFSNVRIKFSYLNANWGWYWAIDNVKVTASQTSEVYWFPTTGLYTDLACTNPYIGIPTSTVYAKPNITTTYIASATSLEGCITETEVLVRVRPINPGVASSNQTVCSTPANLTLTGYVGNVSKWQYSNTLAFTTPVDIPSSNSPTLTAAQMGIFTTRYFRAVVTNLTCTAYSNVITITFSSTTWNGSAWSNGAPDINKAVIFDDSYNSTSDLSVCSVKVNNGDVVFNSGHSLIVQNNVEVTGGTLRFEDSASLVQINESAVNTGPIIYKRNTTPVKKYDYTYWSTPVASQTLFALSPLTLADKYFEFDPVIGNWSFTPSSTIMSIGKGYIVRSPNDFDPVTPSVYNAQFNGIPNNGIISTPIVGNNAYNLIGNPYPSAININTFFDVNGTGTGTGVVDKTIYLWTHNTPVTNNVYTDADYATYNYMGGVGTAPAVNSGVNNTLPLGKVGAGQSFFIKGLSTGNAIFNNSMRVIGNNNQFFKNMDASQVTDVKSRVWLELLNTQGAYKQTMIGYAAGATEDFDSGYDGEFLDSGSAASFYSLLSPLKLAIQGKGLPFNEQDQIPLGYQVNTSGSFEIKLSNFDGVFESQNIYLEDKLLNIIHDLKESSYSFATNDGVFDDRFVLRFNNNSLNNPDQSFTTNSVVVYKDKQDIHINSGTVAMEEISIYDVRGSLIYTKKGIHTTDFVISNLASSQQIILIKIHSVDGAVVTKKIIY